LKESGEDQANCQKASDSMKWNVDLMMMNDEMNDEMNDDVKILNDEMNDDVKILNEALFSFPPFLLLPLKLNFHPFPNLREMVHPKEIFDSEMMMMMMMVVRRR
jgi:hypothetical protein